jgi:transcriptional regulator with XRE-family HTH domain
MREDGLKLWRTMKGLKGYQLAESISISPSSLSEIETGKSLPSAQTITSLMKLEEMDIFWLLTGEMSGDNEFLQGTERVSKNLKKLIENQETGISISRELENNIRRLIKLL